MVSLRQLWAQGLEDRHEHLADFARRQADVLYNLQATYGFMPSDSEQARVLRIIREHPRVAVKSCHGFGKTCMAALSMLDYIQIHQEQGERVNVITTAPTKRQVQKLLWKEVRTWATPKIRRELGWQMPPKESVLETDDEQVYAFGFSTDDPGRFEGFHGDNLFIIIDEGKGVAEEIYESIDGAQFSKILYISTPGSPRGRFYETFKGRGSFELITVDANQLIPPDPAWLQHIRDLGIAPRRPDRAWVDYMRETYGVDSPIFKRKVLGQFAAVIEHPYFTSHSIDRALKRRLPPGWPRVLGVDWAKHVDFNALVTWHGKKCVKVEVNQLPYMTVVGMIVQEHERKPYDAIQADLGAGEGQIERLQEIFEDRGWDPAIIKGFRFTPQSKLRVMSQLKAALDLDEVDLPEHETLEVEMREIQALPRSDGSLKIEAPHDGHDDTVDAAALGYDLVFHPPPKGPIAVGGNW